MIKLKLNLILTENFQQKLTNNKVCLPIQFFLFLKGFTIIFENKILFFKNNSKSFRNKNINGKKKNLNKQTQPYNRLRKYLQKSNPW